MIRLPTNNSSMQRLMSTASSISAKGGNEAFIDFFAKHHVQLSNFQRTILTGGSALLSLIDPYRADMIACLGETTGQRALEYCHMRMQSSPEGQRILREKPRINTTTVDLLKLKKFPTGTLGKIYSDFLDVNLITPDSRNYVHFVEDIELAYVMQRYREVHDIFHAILLMPTTMLGEVSVKWIEAFQTQLPMCIGAALFGAARLRSRQRKLYIDHHLPWAINMGKTSSFLLAVYFEERWEQTIDDFYCEMNIKRLI
ncbi:hypothetical protein PV328_001137 [Microctonus aethiopoides]|uniref:Ubiquinone biosynthesis protein COQ4 homolog, mitochondrial n=1 Tax=Microctonus aethiopoides TaxID=144406 RepID=A0AA39KX68_9HYME|nr:hypothetical protein PV328_001137 [Microctonus aethiopoides]